MTLSIPAIMKNFQPSSCKHRTLMLLYIACMLFYIVPTLNSSERSFDQGQPEKELSMDNMVVHRQPIIQKRTSKYLHIIQKRANSTPKDRNADVTEIKNLQEVNSKTSNYLDEAEEVLKNMSNSNEKKWSKAIVERMRGIEEMIRITTQHKSLEKGVGPTKNSPVPDGQHVRREQPATPAVAEISPSQTPNQILAKIQMVSPEYNRALPDDYHVKYHAVTDPVALPLKSEDLQNDELVRELESLHDENANKRSSEDSKVVNEATTATPSTTVSSQDNQTALVNEESEKGRVEETKVISEESDKVRVEEAKLISELEEFHRRGGTLPKKIVDILYEDAHKTQDSAQIKKINIDEELNKFTEAGMKDRRGLPRLYDVNNEDQQISAAGTRNMPSYVNQQFPYSILNHTFQNKHPNMIQGFPRQIRPYYRNIPSIYRAQPYQSYPLNQNLVKMNPYNAGKYPDMYMYPQPAHYPVVMNPRLPKPQFYGNGRLPPYNYNNYFMRSASGPYPYVHNWNFQNATIHVPQMMTPYINNQVKLNTQLSDEMKRQLRDGKIIVLSDSLVRSNFQADKTEKPAEGKMEEPELQGSGTKNKTVTEN